MKKIDNETLFRYFGAKTTDEEERRINDWLLQDSENEKKLRAAYSLWEAMLFTDAGSDTPVKTAVRHKKSFRRFGIAILNAAAIALFFILAKHIVTINEDNRLAETINRIEVPEGGKMDITLPDGTKVCLNAGAVLDYPMKFARNSREVTISGEAWFDVAHNKAKPFIVKTFLSDVEVLGTKFNLDADESAGRFSVTLEEGSIRLRGNAGERVMAPGEKVEIIGGEMRDCQYRSGKANSWMRRISRPLLIRSASTPRRGRSPTYKSFMSAVPIQRCSFTFATRAMTSWKCASSAMYCIILIIVNL